MLLNSKNYSNQILMYLLSKLVQVFKVPHFLLSTKIGEVSCTIKRNRAGKLVFQKLANLRTETSFPPLFNTLF